MDEENQTNDESELLKITDITNASTIDAEDTVINQQQQFSNFDNSENYAKMYQDEDITTAESCEFFKIDKSAVETKKYVAEGWRQVHENIKKEAEHMLSVLDDDERKKCITNFQARKIINGQTSNISLRYTTLQDRESERVDYDSEIAFTEENSK